MKNDAKLIQFAAQLQACRQSLPPSGAARDVLLIFREMLSRDAET